jgi:hypothetical protein
VTAAAFCEICGALIDQPLAGRRTGRRRRFCSNAHRQLAYRRRTSETPSSVTKLDAELRNRLRREIDRRRRLQLVAIRRVAA